MKWQEVWQQLEQKEVAPCYLLTGEETYLISQTVSKIEAALELGELGISIWNSWKPPIRQHMAAAVARSLAPDGAWWWSLNP